MGRISKLYFANQGYFILGICLLSLILAILGLTGISGHETLFFSAWVLTFTLPVFLFFNSVLYRSPVWTLTSISMLMFLCLMLTDHLRGGGYWLPVMNGRMLCYSSLIYSLAGVAVFYFTDWKKERLTAERKKSLIVISLTYPIASAIYLCGAPLWVSFITLFSGYGYLFYGFRVMLFWDAFRGKGVNAIYDDIRTSI